MLRYLVAQLRTATAACCWRGGERARKAALAEGLAPSLLRWLLVWIARRPSCRLADSRRILVVVWTKRAKSKKDEAPSPRRGERSGPYLVWPRIGRDGGSLDVARRKRSKPGLAVKDKLAYGEVEAGMREEEGSGQVEGVG